LPAIIERVVPTTGETLPTLAMGCWGIGGRTTGNTSYGDTDDARSRLTLDAAIERGVGFFDVAPAYGNGHAERLLGEAIHGRRDRAFVATKVGRPRFDATPDFDADAMRRGLEASLTRLGVDDVDLVQAHDPAPEQIADGTLLRSLIALKEAGLSRHVGVSCKAPEHGLTLLDQGGVDFLQINLNLMDQRALACGLLERAVGRAALIARTPLCFGFLAGALPDNPRFGPGDHRNNWPDAQIKRWIEGARGFVESAAAETAMPILELALRFCLSFPAITAVLPGMMGPEEVEANADAVAKGPLDPALLTRIKTYYQGTEFFLPRQAR